MTTSWNLPMCGQNGSSVASDCLRGRKLLAMEEAVRLMTEVPARLFGLSSRGKITEGFRADLVIFDPESVGATPARIAFDLPGQSKRLLADPVGVKRVMVNGATTLLDGRPTGARPGTVLRSARDTTGTAIRADDHEKG